MLSSPKPQSYLPCQPTRRNFPGSMVRVCRSRWPLICIEIHGAYLSFVRCFPPVPVCWLLKGPDKSFKCSPLFHQNVGIFACGGLAAGAPTTWQSYCQLHCLSSRSLGPICLCRWVASIRGSWSLQAAKVGVGSSGSQCRVPHPVDPQNVILWLLVATLLLSTSQWRG